MESLKFTKEIIGWTHVFSSSHFYDVLNGMVDLGFIVLWKTISKLFWLRYFQMVLNSCHELMAPNIAIKLAMIVYVNIDIVFVL